MTSFQEKSIYRWDIAAAILAMTLAAQANSFAATPAATETQKIQVNATMKESFAPATDSVAITVHSAEPSSGASPTAETQKIQVNATMKERLAPATDSVAITVQTK